MNSEEQDILKEAGEILAALVDQRITEAQRTRLAELLRSSQAAREYYHDYLDAHEDLLDHYGGGENELPAFLEQLNSTSVPPTRRRRRAARRRTLSAQRQADSAVRRWTIRLLPTVAAAALVAVVIFFLRPGPRPTAVLQNAVDAEWDRALQVGDRLPSGPVTLAGGTAEISFGKGAKVVISGPARFEVLNENATRLYDGSLYANIPRSAHGFRVDTAACSLIDMGTEFGLRVDEQGVVETHVVRGAVRALTPDETRATHIPEGQARAVRPETPNQIHAIPFDDSQFVKQLPARELHWEFKPDESGKMYAKRPDGSVVYSATPKPSVQNGPRAEESSVGPALFFDGEDDYLQTDYKGVGGAQPRTVLLWAKIPEEVRQNTNVVVMVSWGSFRRSGGVWQMTWNNNPEEGHVGALRIGTWRGQAVGTTDLRDNQWHHLAVVMDGPDIATGIRLYVDGQLEQMQIKNVPIRTLLQTDMYIGQSIRPGTVMLFKGWLSGLRVYNTSLSTEQIRQAAKATKAESK